LIKYGRVLGKITIHPLFWLIAGIAMITGYFWELLTLFMIVLVHELGHAIAAQYFSWKIKKIRILPFGGICEVDEHGNRPIAEEFLIVIAGPLQHIWMAAAAFLFQAGGWITAESALMFQQFNLMILFFNLLPIWPLDGGKLLYLLLASRQPFLNAIRQSLYSSFLLLVAVHLVMIFISPMHLHAWVVFIYLYISLWLELKQVKYVFMRFLLERYYGKQSGIKRLEVIEAKGNDLLFRAMEKFQRDCKHLIHVGSNESTIGKLDENEMLHAYFAEKQVNARLKEIVFHE